MRAIAIVLAVMIGILAAPASAQLDPTIDAICVVFDTGTLENCVASTVGQTVTAYYVILGPTAPDMTGWEIAPVISPAPPIPPTWNPPPGIIPIVWGPPDFVLAYSTPVPWADMHVLMSVDVIMLSGDAFYFYAEPIADTCASPAAPAYYTGTGYECVPLVPCTAPGQPLACINCDCEEVIPNLEESWGAIKSMYR